MKELNYKIELTDQQFDLLIKLKNDKYAEYRDNYDTLEDFLKSDDHKLYERSEQWFMDRNYNGTYNEMRKLFELNLVDSDDMAWHETYILSEYGKEVLKQNGLF